MVSLCSPNLCFLHSCLGLFWFIHAPLPFSHTGSCAVFSTTRSLVPTSGLCISCCLFLQWFCPIFLQNSLLFFFRSLYKVHFITEIFQAIVSKTTPSPFFFLVLGLELRAFTLSHSTSPVFVKGFLR
jgi:hypothetical protein